MNEIEKVNKKSFGSKLDEECVRVSSTGENDQTKSPFAINNYFGFNFRWFGFIYHWLSSSLFSFGSSVIVNARLRLNAANIFVMHI